MYSDPMLELTQIDKEDEMNEERIIWCRINSTIERNRNLRLVNAAAYSF